MGDKKFAIILSLFAVIGLSLTLALLTMVLLDEKDHSDGTSSMSGGGGPPLQSLNLRGD